MAKAPVTLILAATNPALGIGRNGTLPWRLKREMKFFRQATDGATVVMGRKTWDSILPKYRPLANRTNIVVSRNTTAEFGEGVLTASSVEEALAKADSSLPVFVIGGAQIYEASLPHASHILLTLVEDPQNSIECDTFFKFDKTQFARQPSSALAEFVGSKVDLPEGEVEENGYHYNFTLWNRI